MPTLSERALLVSLNISQWTARKLDRKETRDVNQRHGLTSEVARVNKNLLPMATSLERVHVSTSAIRREFSLRTLPWMSDGVNVLKASAYMDFTTIANGWRSNWQAEVDAFVSDYPALLADAAQTLNGLFDAADYPSPHDIARRFAMDIRFLPVPDEKDWRVDVGDDEIVRLKADITRHVHETEGRAMAEAWARVKAVVEKAQERLASPDAVFRDSLVENARELCSILPGLNITDDPALERARQDLEGALCRHDPGTLRNDPSVRSSAASALGDILSRMAGAYSPPQG